MFHPVHLYLDHLHFIYVQLCIIKLLASGTSYQSDFTFSNQKSGCLYKLKTSTSHKLLDLTCFYYKLSTENACKNFKILKDIVLTDSIFLCIMSWKYFQVSNVLWFPRLKLPMNLKFILLQNLFNTMLKNASNLNLREKIQQKAIWR